MAQVIGSHTCLSLLEDGYDVTVLKNFSNSSPIALDRVEHLSGRKLSVVNGDIRDESFLEEVFQGIERNNERFDLVVHLAGVKSVAESVKDPLKYWDVNLTGSQKLFAAMRTHECKIYYLVVQVQFMEILGAFHLQRILQLVPFIPMQK